MWGRKRYHSTLQIAGTVREIILASGSSKPFLRSQPCAAVKAHDIDHGFKIEVFGTGLAYVWPGATTIGPNAAHEASLARRVN